MPRGYALWVDAIDWGMAQRIGERIAGSPPPGGVRAASVQPRAHEFARRVSDYSYLPQPAELPQLEAVDRSAWIAANLRTMRPLLGGLSERIGAGAGPLAGPLRERVPVEKQVPFIADLWAHSASYAVGFFGGIVIMVRVWRSRGRTGSMGAISALRTRAKDWRCRSTSGESSFDPADRGPGGCNLKLSAT